MAKRTKQEGRPTSKRVKKAATNAAAARAATSVRSKARRTRTYFQRPEEMGT